MWCCEYCIEFSAFFNHETEWSDVFHHVGGDLAGVGDTGALLLQYRKRDGYYSSASRVETLTMGSGKTTPDAESFELCSSGNDVREKRTLQPMLTTGTNCAEWNAGRNGRQLCPPYWEVISVWFLYKKRLKSKLNEIVWCSAYLVAEKDDVVSLDQGVEFPAAHQVGKEVEIFLSSCSRCVWVNVTWKQS